MKITPPRLKLILLVLAVAVLLAPPYIRPSLGSGMADTEVRPQQRAEQSEDFEGGFHG